MDFSAIITTITVWALPVLFAITLHEAGHAYAAQRLGDPTAAMMGRVTLNPIKHIDPVGTFVLPLLLYISTGGKFMFGYAKPVPVAFGRLKNPKRDMIWVALAGPLANFLQVGFWAVFALMLSGLDINEMFFYKMAGAGVLVNIGMFAFNLFPLPPLDGGRILMGVLPMRAAALLARTERIGMVLVIALIFLGVISKIWLQPIFEAFLSLPVLPALVHIALQ
jgi:Zn-dependent protease